MSFSNYKHFLSISSQISFCAAPIRLDSYNNCQFSCSYCFAASRTGHGREAKLNEANPEQLERRLQRVQQGNLKSALDEFLSVRTPIQFGGMSDPFMPIEERSGTTLKILEILAHYGYPFLLSTKGKLIFESKYINTISKTNSLVRFSFSGCSQNLRENIDKGTLTFTEFLRRHPLLRDAGIKVGIRLQPIIPGEEEFALSMIRQLDGLDICHISAEYLKVPPSARRYFGKNIQEYFSGDIIKYFQDIGGKLIGNEYSLPLLYRKSWLDKFAHEARKIGSTFGYADNDLLLFSDGNGCCSGSDIHLEGSNNFRANTVGILRIGLEENKPPSFDNIEHTWLPERNISQYLNSKTRIRIEGTTEMQWKNYAKASWEGRWGQYNPGYFVFPKR